MSSDDGGRPGGDCEPLLKVRASWGEVGRMWRGDGGPEGSLPEMAQRRAVGIAWEPCEGWGQSVTSSCHLGLRHGPGGRQVGGYSGWACSLDPCSFLPCGPGAGAWVSSEGGCLLDSWELTQDHQLIHRTTFHGGQAWQAPSMGAGGTKNKLYSYSGWRGLKLDSPSSLIPPNQLPRPVCLAPYPKHRTQK